MHHPGCWVTNSGCATQSPHKSTPMAQAYSTSRAAGAQAPHPGEGVRVAPRAAARPSPSTSPSRRARVPEVEDEERASEPVIGAPPESWPVIGGTPAPAPAMVRRSRPQETFIPPSPPRRYLSSSGEVPGPGKPLPKIYGGNPIARYWFVPAAVVLALLVAFGVIWGVDQVTGGSSKASTTPTTAPGAASTAPPAAGATTAATAAAAGDTAPAAGAGSTKFHVGDVAVVTGAGDCLNVRVAAGVTNAEGQPNNAIVCLKDGEEVSVIGGPQAATELQWWNVRTKLGDGWAAEDYLVKKP
jgi:hypothetical protein